MAWDADRLREEVMVDGLSDAALAVRYQTTPKAVEMARYRLGIRTHLRCPHCQRVVPVADGRTSKLQCCEDCLDRRIAIYLASRERVEVLERRLGVSRTTLQVEARARYGLTRQHVTPAMRVRILELLRDTNADELRSTLEGGSPRAD